jgi:hypothetical protein
MSDGELVEGECAEVVDIEVDLRVREDQRVVVIEKSRADDQVQLERSRDL